MKPGVVHLKYPSAVLRPKAVVEPQIGGSLTRGKRLSRSDALSEGMPAREVPAGIENNSELSLFCRNCIHSALRNIDIDASPPELTMQISGEPTQTHSYIANERPNRVFPGGRTIILDHEVRDPSWTIEEEKCQQHEPRDAGISCCNKASEEHRRTEVMPVSRAGLAMLR